MSALKYPEFILALSRETFLRLGIREGFNEQFAYDEFIELVQNGIVIRQRQHLDEMRPWGESHKGDRDYSQWLNYLTIENSDGTIHPYLRARTGNGETNLQGRGSIGAGGHTDLIDVAHHNSVIDLRETVLNNVVRELFEELQFFIDGQRIVTHTEEGVLLSTARTLSQLGRLYFEGIIFDNSDNVGRLHFAVALRFVLHPTVTIKGNEDGLDFIPAVRPQYLGSTYPDVTFENWSKLYAFHLCNADAPIPKNDLLRFLPGHVV